MSMVLFHRFSSDPYWREVQERWEQIESERPELAGWTVDIVQLPRTQGGFLCAFDSVAKRATFSFGVGEDSAFARREGCDTAAEFGDHLFSLVAGYCGWEAR